MPAYTGDGANVKRYFCDFCGRCSSEQNANSDFWPMYMHYDPYLIMCSSCKRAHPDDFKLYFSEPESEKKITDDATYVYVVLDDDRCTPNSTAQVYVYQNYEDAKHMFYGLFDALFKDTKDREDISFWIHKLKDGTLACDIKCYGEDAGSIQVLKMSVIK